MPSDFADEGIADIDAIIGRTAQWFHERGLHALERAPINDGIQYIKGLQQESGGFPLMEDEEVTPLMTGYALLAMGHVGIEINDPTPMRALNYLRAVQHPSGGFGYYVDSGPSLGPTAIVAQALRALGADRTNLMLQACQRFIAGKYRDGRWRESLTVEGEEEGAMEVALTAMCALALKDTLLVSERHEIIRELIEARNYDGGWGWSASHESDADHTSMAVIALRSLTKGLEDAPEDALVAIDQGVQYLLSCQRADGGFALKAGREDTSVIDTTGLAVLALAFEQAQTEDAVRQAASFFLRTQNVDGGWGDRPGAKSDLDSTYFVLRALMAAGETIITLNEVERGLRTMGEEMKRLFGQRMETIVNERDELAANLRDAERKAQMLEAALGVTATIAGVVLAMFGLG